MNKNIPNIISLLRIILFPVLFVLFFFELYIASAVYFAVLAFTDWVDGFIARKYDIVSNIGKFLDPIADKILVVAAMFLLAVSASSALTVYSYAICFTLLIVRDFCVNGLRLVAGEKGVVIAADIFGKIKTVALDVALTLLLLSPLHEIVLYCGLAVLYFATAMSILGGVNYLMKNRKVFY